MFNPLINKILDASIIYSFDRRGYLRHQQSFNKADTEKDLSGKNALITGANAGIGYSLALSLAQRNANVYLLCRNPEKGEKAVQAIQEQTKSTSVYLEIIDVSDLSSVQLFLSRFTIAEIHIFIVNAGILPNHYQTSPQGYENTLATNLLGHHLLIRDLWTKLTGGRVVLISSGGMYPVPLKLGRLFNPRPKNFDGVRQYALTKRAQVILTALLAEEGEKQGTIIHSMHPGWVNTGGVQSSLPKFWERMKDNLRTPAEGADTALWLAISDQGGESSGRFWFDRKEQATRMIHQRPPSSALKQELWTRLEKIIADYRTVQ